MRGRRAARGEHGGKGRGHVEPKVVVEREAPSMRAAERRRLARPVTSEIEGEHVEAEGGQPPRERDFGSEIEADVVRPHSVAKDDGVPARRYRGRAIPMQREPPAVVGRGEQHFVGPKLAVSGDFFDARKKHVQAERAGT
jgi:hypothetical protein